MNDKMNSNGNYTGTAKWENGDASVAHDQEGLLSSSSPDESLFRLDTSPSVQEEELKSRLDDFFSQNFRRMGYVDGSRLISENALFNAKDILKSRFQMLVDREICRIEEKILELELLIIEIENPSDVVTKRIERTIEFNRASIEKLNEQNRSTEQEQGWVMEAIHSYEAGFRNGREDTLVLRNYYRGVPIFNL